MIDFTGEKGRNSVDTELNNYIYSEFTDLHELKL